MEPGQSKIRRGHKVKINSGVRIRDILEKANGEHWGKCNLIWASAGALESAT